MVSLKRTTSSLLYWTLLWKTGLQQWEQRKVEVAKGFGESHKEFHKGYLIIDCGNRARTELASSHCTKNQMPRTIDATMTNDQTMTQTETFA